MTIDNKHNFADAEVLLDSDYFPSTDGEREPIAQAVLVSDESQAKTSVATPIASATTVQSAFNTGFRIVNNQNGTTPSGGGQDPDDMTAHNVQHRKNVVTGVISGVLIGAIILGPIGAIAGGFIGNSIVNGRERRWCHHHGFAARGGRYSYRGHHARNHCDFHHGASHCSRGRRW
jgi:hypothetical protein